MWKNRLILLITLLVACWCMLFDAVLCTNSTHHAAVRNTKQSRQYSSPYSSYASPSLYSTPIEAIIVGVLAVCGISLFGIPLLFMLANMFNYNVNPGVSVIPTATTSVSTAGRRKRQTTSNYSPWQMDQKMLSQVVDSFNTFLQSKEKMQFLQSLIS